MNTGYTLRDKYRTFQFLRYSMITMFVLGIMALFGGFFLEYQRGVADPVGAEIMRRILQFFGYDSFPVAARLSFFLAAICHLYCILMSPAHLTLKKKLGR